jgi:hypothetical protein
MGAVLPGRWALGTLGVRRLRRHATPKEGLGMHEERSGWVTFAAVLFLIVGTLNVIYGIAAIGDSSFFVRDARYVVSNLNTWGWITLGIGILQLLAGGSLRRGGLYGRAMGIVVASLSAIAALLSMPGYPFWGLAIFALNIVIIHQIAAHGTEGRAASADAPSASAVDWDAMAQTKQ